MAMATSLQRSSLFMADSPYIDSCLNLSTTAPSFTKATSFFPQSGRYIRRDSTVHVFPCQTNIKILSIEFQGRKFLNSLRRDIQNSESVGLFGKRLRKFQLF